MFRSIAEQFSL